MGFGHEKLDVYRAAIEYVGWAYRFCESLKSHRNAKDQLKLGQRGYAVNEDQAQYTVGGDPDPNTDPDAEGKHNTQWGVPRFSARTARLTITGDDYEKRCEVPNRNP